MILASVVRPNNQWTGTFLKGNLTTLGVSFAELTSHPGVIAIRELNALLVTFQTICTIEMS